MKGNSIRHQTSVYSHAEAEREGVIKFDACRQNRFSASLGGAFGVGQPVAEGALHD